MQYAKKIIRLRNISLSSVYTFTVTFNVTSESFITRAEISDVLKYSHP